MTIPTAHGAAHAPNFPAKTPNPKVWGKRPEALFGALLIEAGPDTRKTHTEKGQGFF